MEFGPSSRQLERDHQSNDGKGKNSKGNGKGKGAGKKGFGSGLEESHIGKGKGKKGHSGKGKGKKGKGKGKGKGKARTEEEMEYVRQEIAREIEEGFDPGLQQSRGRTYRILRKQNRAIDPEVQARREAYEKGDMERPETRPMPMTEGSQRWKKSRHCSKKSKQKGRKC